MTTAHELRALADRDRVCDDCENLAAEDDYFCPICRKRIDEAHERAALAAQKEQADDR